MADGTSHLPVASHFRPTRLYPPPVVSFIPTPAASRIFGHKGLMSCTSTLFKALES